MFVKWGRRSHFSSEEPSPPGLPPPRHRSRHKSPLGSSGPTTLTGTVGTPRIPVRDGPQSPTHRGRRSPWKEGPDFPEPGSLQRRGPDGGEWRRRGGGWGSDGGAGKSVSTTHATLLDPEKHRPYSNLHLQRDLLTNKVIHCFLLDRKRLHTSGPELLWEVTLSLYRDSVGSLVTVCARLSGRQPFNFTVSTRLRGEPGVETMVPLVLQRRGSLGRTTRVSDRVRHVPRPRTSPRL